MRKNYEQQLLEAQGQIQYVEQNMVNIERIMTIAMLYLVLANYTPNYLKM